MKAEVTQLYPSNVQKNGMFNPLFAARFLLEQMHCCRSGLSHNLAEGFVIFQCPLWHQKGTKCFQKVNTAKEAKSLGVWGSFAQESF